MSENISFKEHTSVLLSVEGSSLSDKSIAFLKDFEFEGPPKARNERPKHLGLVRTGDQLQAHYYVGTTWLKEGEIYAVVEPKIDNLNFEAMLGKVLRQKENAKYLTGCYGIDYGETAIPADKNISENLILMMLMHYISLLKNIAKTGLRKDYITVEENLHSKIKGRILVSKNIIENDLNFRSDRMYCAYQTYTEDIPVNRLLKKALYRAEKIINGYACIKEDKKLFERLHHDISKLKPLFMSVTSDISVHDVMEQKFSKLFRGYDDAVKVAKMILRQEANESEAGERRLPPFWIDMTGIFELYVLGLLNESYPNRIEFQVPGSHQTKCDYIDKKDKIIIDAKYKPWYANIKSITKQDEINSNSEKTATKIAKSPTDDIRELSGYARDITILEKMQDIDKVNYIPPCVIIYPDIEHGKDGIRAESLLDQCKQLKEYVKFYMLGIKLPLKK